MSGVSVVCARVDGVKNDILRTMGDKIRDKGENMILPGGFTGEQL